MLNLVEGWTEPIDYVLYKDGATFDITGFTVAVKFYNASGSSVTPTGVASILTAASSTVRYTPSGVTELLNANSPLKMRWKITDLSGKISYFPNDDAEVWNIHLP